MFICYESFFYANYMYNSNNNSTRITMQKDELISATNGMCKELLNAIENNKSATKDEIADLLIESAQVIMNVSDEDISKVSFAELLFSNAYRDLTNKSLLSYETTNSNIDKLTKMHKKVILECNEQQIDLSTLTVQFDEIQEHMKNEVVKANEIISQLTSQVKALEETSNLDSLTRVYNRRALSSYMDSVCSNDHQPEDLHVLIMDIDDFKHINDSYGHIAGDKVLIFIAHMLKKTLRDGDKVFRYGGEEFLIVLNRLDDKQCEIISERLLELVRQNKLLYKGKSLRVTMSLGATRYTKGDTPTSLIARADEALYKAKDGGKNQKCVVNK